MPLILATFAKNTRSFDEIICSYDFKYKHLMLDQFYNFFVIALQSVNYLTEKKNTKMLLRL